MSLPLEVEALTLEVEALALNVEALALEVEILTLEVETLTLEVETLTLEVETLNVEALPLKVEVVEAVDFLFFFSFVACSILVFFFSMLRLVGLGSHSRFPNRFVELRLLLWKFETANFFSRGF